MNKDPHIIVIGDSYSVGEWQPSEVPAEQIPHNGVSEYFYLDGYSVTNLGIPGAAPDWMLYPLENFLLANQYIKNKKIIVFQTDISRNLSPIGSLNDDTIQYWKKVIKNNPRKTVTEILDLLYLDFYRRLDEITKSYQIDFLLVGGVTDITADISSLNRFKVAVPSMINLMDSTVPSDLRLLSNRWNVIDELFSDRKEELIYLMEQQEKRNEYLKTHIHWYLDGFHPSREAHKVCYQKIKESL